MPITDPQEELRTFIKEAAALGLPPDQLQGVAFYDTAKDELFTSLKSFDSAVAALGCVPNLESRLGLGETKRIALQFIYEYFEVLGSPVYDAVRFESLWANFVGELEDPNWLYCGVANLRYFRSEVFPINLGDGMTIEGRNPNELASFFGPAIANRILDDWSGFGVSSFVLVAKHAASKTPENVMSMDSGTIWTNAMRAIGTLRLIAPGDVSIGQMWVIRKSRFNTGMGGLASTGTSVSHLGTPYTWTAALSSDYSTVYRDLAHLEKVGQAPVSNERQQLPFC